MNSSMPREGMARGGAEMILIEHSWLKPVRYTLYRLGLAWAHAH